METSTILHILRNPWGWPQVEQRQARLAAADLIEARLWQPIETAPRDGTTILVIIPNADSPKAVALAFYKHGLCWIHTWDTFPFHDRNAPIYWMPIADLPARTPTT